MKKYFRALDHVVIALKNLEEGNPTEVSAALLSALAEPDYEEAMIALNEIQASNKEDEVVARFKEELADDQFNFENDIDLDTQVVDETEESSDDGWDDYPLDLTASEESTDEDKEEKDYEETVVEEEAYVDEFEDLDETASVDFEDLDSELASDIEDLDA